MRSWIVVPVLAVGGAALAAVLGRATPEIVAAGLAAAGVAGAIRVIAGDEPAALAAAACAPIIAIAAMVEGAGAVAVAGAGRGSLVGAWLALAAIGWTVAELAKPTRSPLVAVVPAAVAAACGPAGVALLPIVGWRLWRTPGTLPRWVALAPVLAALIAAGVRWYGRAPAAQVELANFARALGDALGPLLAVAALAGLTRLRARLADLAIAACVAVALAADLRCGAISPTTLGLAALLAGLALERFAGTIRLPVGQAVAGATAGALLVAAPAWIAVERTLEPRVSLVRASR